MAAEEENQLVLFSVDKTPAPLAVVKPQEPVIEQPRAVFRPPQAPEAPVPVRTPEEDEAERLSLFNETMRRVSAAFPPDKPLSLLKSVNYRAFSNMEAAEANVDKYWKACRLGMATLPELRSALLDWERRAREAIKILNNFDKGAAKR